MKIGYARVSTKDQILDLQKDALQKEGCQIIFEETASGVRADRPQLQKLIDGLRKDDTVVIWKLDRLGRSLPDLVKLVSHIHEKEAGLKSISDPIDTTTAQGKLIFHLFAALAEFERDIISERTKAGLESAKSRGRKGGRPKGLSQKAKDKSIVVETLYKEGKMSISEICKNQHIARSTVYKYLRYRVSNK